MNKRKRITRKDTKHAAFGQAHPLSAHQLPLIGDVSKNCWRYKHEAGQFANVNEIVKKAALDVSTIWTRAIADRLTAPLLDQKVIQDKLKRLYQKGLIGSINEQNLTKLNKFKMEMNKFFDICSCNCLSASCFQVNCIAKNCNTFHLVVNVM